MAYTWKDSPPAALLAHHRSGPLMSNPDRTAYDPRGRTDAAALPADGGWETRSIDHAPDEITPRVRVNVKRLANGAWQPDITVESYDADPLTAEGRDRIGRRLSLALMAVNREIAEWERSASNAI